MAYVFRSGAGGAGGGGGAVMRRPQGRGLNAASKTPDVGSRFLPSHLPPEEQRGEGVGPPTHPDFRPTQPPGPTPRGRVGGRLATPPPPNPPKGNILTEDK